MDFEFNLVKAGFSKAQAKTYLALLSLGQSKATEIALKAKINRGAAYYALQELKERGFVSEVIRSGVRNYSASTPERVLSLLSEENRQKEEVMKDNISILKSIETTTIPKPRIQMFEGYEGFKTIFEILLDKKEKELLCFLAPDALKYLSHFHEQFRKKRAARGISIRTITELTELQKDIKKYEKAELRQTKFADNKLFEKSESIIYILKDAIIIIKSSPKEQLGIYIQDAGVANMHKNLFEKMWSGLKFYK